jgi:DNA-binding NtrC family response regulator
MMWQDGGATTLETTACVKGGVAMTEETRTGRHPSSDEGDSPTLSWSLRVLYAADTGIANAEARLVAAQAPLRIGRGDFGDVTGHRLRLQDARVSREHAQLTLSESGAKVVDLGSKNGTDVNGRRLSSGEPYVLADGDVLRLGDSFVLVRHEPDKVADAPISSLLGVSQAASRLRCAVARCTQTDAAVLILGETGTGKEVVAQAIHSLSGRPGKLAAVNCAALPATLAEAQFFGVARGAYTGAVEQAGFFAEAHQGTLFLDEVGDLPIEVQPKLLRAIETRLVTPLGSSRTVPCDVRVVAATNRDLEVALRAGTFRADLYARLSSVIVRTPLLRQRREDILLLLQHFAGAGLRPSPRLVAALLAYSFPLNVRELGHVAVGLRTGSEEEEIRRLKSAVKGAGSPVPTYAADRTSAAGAAPAEKKSSAMPTREELIRLLAQYQGSLRRVEKEHGYPRRNLRRWAERYGIGLDEYRRDPA